MESRKTVSLIVPSDIVARGLGSILEESGEFRVEEVFHDFSKAAESRLRGVDPDVVIIDPVILDFKSRKEGRVGDLVGTLRTEHRCDTGITGITVQPDIGGMKTGGSRYTGTTDIKKHSETG